MELYRPTEVLKPVSAGLWIVDGPIIQMAVPGLKIPFPTRMVVARLADGGLWLWSPIAPSPELRAQVDALGPVRHLVSPNKLHYAHIPAWQAAYPEAVAWASAGVRERAASQGIEARFDRDLGDAPEAEWAADLDQLVFGGSFFIDEVVFLHRASRTLILADLIENFEPAKLTRTERWAAWAGGVTDPDAQTPLDFRATFCLRRGVARACRDRMLAWAPERVVLAHGRWYEQDGLVELRRAFRWLG